MGCLEEVNALRDKILPTVPLALRLEIDNEYALALYCAEAYFKAKDMVVDVDFGNGPLKDACQDPVIVDALQSGNYTKAYDAIYKMHKNNLSTADICAVTGLHAPDVDFILKEYGKTQIDSLSMLNRIDSSGKASACIKMYLYLSKALGKQDYDLMAELGINLNSYLRLLSNDGSDSTIEILASQCLDRIRKGAPREVDSDVLYNMSTEDIFRAINRVREKYEEDYLADLGDPAKYLNNIIHEDEFTRCFLNDNNKVDVVAYVHAYEAFVCFDQNVSDVVLAAHMRLPLEDIKTLRVYYTRCKGLGSKVVRTKAKDELPSDLIF